MDRIRCGIAGLRHGMASVLEVVKDPAFELVALASRTPESYGYLRGEPIAERLDSVTFTAPREELIAECRRHRDFAQVAFYDDFATMLRHDGLDAVILAVPIALNAPYAVAALEAGKHVLSSKPFARTLEQGRALHAAALRARGRFMVNFQFRQSPLSRAIEAQLARGAIGELRLMWWNMFRMPFRPSYRRKEASGGPFLAEVCHWFDLFQLFNGDSPFERLAAFGGLDVLRGQQDFADNAVCIVEYANGVRASVDFSYFTDQPQHNLFGLVGSQGKITADTEAAGSFVMYAGATRDRTEFTVDPAAGHHGHLGFDVAHRRFARAILDGADVNRLEADRGFENTVISLAAQTALDSGGIVRRSDFLKQT